MSLRNLLLLAVFICSTVASFYMGTRVGAEQNTWGTAQFRLMTHYGYLKRGSLEEVRSLANQQLDFELSDHMLWVNSSWRWLFPELIIENDKYAAAAAEYRMANPYIHRQLDLSKFDPDDAVEMRRREAEVHKEIQDALDYYRRLGLSSVDGAVD